MELPAGFGVSLPQDGLWYLPPKQDVLTREEDDVEFTLDDVADDLTIVITSSVGEFTPSTDIVITALRSLQDNLALHWCRKILVFDEIPSEQEIEAMKQNPKHYHTVVRGPKWEHMWRKKREAYTAYCFALNEMKLNNDPTLFQVELVFLPRFSHLFGTVRHALELVKSSYVLVTQHDLRLSGKFVAADVQRVLGLMESESANCVILNRDTNSGSRPKSYFRMDPDSDIYDSGSRTRLTAVRGFSDQTHFAHKDWYLANIMDRIPDDCRLTCMEHILHNQFKNERDFRGIFLYGGSDDGPFTYDLIHGTQISSRGGRQYDVEPMPARLVPK